MNINWAGIIASAVLAALTAHPDPKIRGIANEVSDGAKEAEQLFSPGSGPEKLNHVLNIAKAAAQATDELRGSQDDVAGPVTMAVNAGVAAANAVKQVISVPQSPSA